MRALKLVVEQYETSNQTSHEEAKMWHRSLGHSNTSTPRGLLESPTPNIRVPSKLRDSTRLFCVLNFKGHAKTSHLLPSHSLLIKRMEQQRSAN